MSIEINGVVYQDENAPDALKAKLAVVESEKTGLVAELTGDRKKNREAIEAKDTEVNLLKEALKQATEKNTAAPEDAKITSIVEAALANRDKAKAIDSRKLSFDKFVNEHKEYHPDNDPGGLKRSALERELNGLTAWVNPSADDDFTAVIGKANALLRGTDTSRQTNMQSQSSMPSSHSEPRETPNDKLTPKERELITRNGMSEDSFLKLKDKMPDYVEGLIAQMR